MSIIPYADRLEAARVYAHILGAAKKQGKDAQLGTLADLGRRDLFFLLTRLLRRPDADCNWVFDRCCEVQASPDGMLDLWAREHYKSTIITYAQTIRDILNDPEITVGIFSHTRPVAKDFLKQIKREFETNDALKAIYPDVLWQYPQREAPTWSEDAGIIVKRQGNPKEATVEAWGLVDGQPTGKHFSLLVYDDVVTRESVTTPEMIKKVTEAWALSLNLGAHGGRRRCIGTRYHYNDTWNTILERKAATPRIYAATFDGRPEGPPRFLARAQLDAKLREMGSYVFSCQMLQNPKADAAMSFQRPWLRYCPMDDDKRRNMNVYIIVDPAGERKKGSDYTVMWVLGLGADRNYYKIDGVRDRLNLTQRAAALFRLVRKYKPLAVGYEKYGMQADIEHIESEMDKQGYHFTIIPLGGQMPKNDRIRRLVPLFEQGRIFLPGVLPYRDVNGEGHNLTQEFVNDEYLSFPVATHDDMLDCLARILDEDLGAVFPDEWADAVAVGGMDNLGGNYGIARGVDDYNPFESMS